LAGINQAPPWSPEKWKGYLFPKLHDQIVIIQWLYSKISPQLIMSTPKISLGKK